MCGRTDLENKVAQSGEIGAVPAEQMTLDLLDSDGVLVLSSHLVDAARDADHALQCSLDHLVPSLRSVMVVHDVLHEYSQ